MKLSATSQNAFGFETVLSPFPTGARTAGRRSQYRIKPLDLETGRPTLAESDDLGRKQETVCAVLLALSLLYTLVHCMAQFGSL